MGGRPFATLPGRPPTELTSIFTYSLSFTLVALDLTIGGNKYLLQGLFCTFLVKMSYDVIGKDKERENGG